MRVHNIKWRQLQAHNWLTYTISPFLQKSKTLKKPWFSRGFTHIFDYQMEVFDSGMGFEYFSGCLGTFSNGLVRNAVARSRTKVPTLLQRRGGEANAKVALQEAGCGQWGYWA